MPIELPTTLLRLVSRCRVQLIRHIIRFIPTPRPLLLLGSGASLRLCETIAQHGVSQLMVVTDKLLAEAGLIQPLLAECDSLGIRTTVFDEVLPDPTDTIVDSGAALAEASAAQAILAVGGGSSIDAAKIIAIKAGGAGDPLKKSGPILRAGLPIYAVPTTAGTGSEVSLGAIITDSATHEKRPLGGPGVVPTAAALDPVCTRSLPPAITAATGMDALTHAIEAYIGRWRNPEVDNYALTAAALILEHLPTAFSKGDDLAAREAMLVGAAYGGFAINANFVGNVHAIAHQLGARYGVPHGLANAVLLPHLLEFSRSAAAGRMADISRRAGLADTTTEDLPAAQALIDHIKELNKLLEIPETLPAVDRADIPSIAQAAVREGAGYPTPHFLDQPSCERILGQVAL